MTTPETIKLVVDGLGALLIPVVLFVLGQWFLRSKERSDRAREDATQMAVFVEHLSSESKARRKLALLALNHMRHSDLFPQILYEAVESIAARDEPDVAAYAELALGTAGSLRHLTGDQRALLLELLMPVKVHFERSRRAFQYWADNRPTKPNVEIEDSIKVSNSIIRTLLRSNWDLIPHDLEPDARRLVEHYDAWEAEYHRVRPKGIRDPNIPYVWAGPQGFPFPRDSERRFLERYATTLAADSRTIPQGAETKPES
jgi:hypothetical protein